jgi:hypothetical protein
MTEQIFYVIVPEELTDLTKEAGFNESYNWRGAGGDAARVSLELVGTWISLGANGITILVGMSQLRGLIELVRGWGAKRGEGKLDRVEIKLETTSGRRSATFAFAISDETLDRGDIQRLGKLMEAIAETFDDE